MAEYTREDLIRALEICAGEDCYSYDAVRCPLHDEGRCLYTLKRGAAAELRRAEETEREFRGQMAEALNEIRRLQAENDRLHRENLWLTGHGAGGEAGGKE